MPGSFQQHNSVVKFLLTVLLFESALSSNHEWSNHGISFFFFWKWRRFIRKKLNWFQCHLMHSKRRSRVYALHAQPAKANMDGVLGSTKWAGVLTLTVCFGFPIQRNYPFSINGVSQFQESIKAKEGFSCLHRLADQICRQEIFFFGQLQSEML